jgi:hypothetical protein
VLVELDLKMTASTHPVRHMMYIAKVLAWMALGIWLSFIYLTLQYDATRTTVQQPSQGRIYDLNNHGHVVYLNSEEQDNLYYLQVGALALFLTAFVVGHYSSHPKRVVDIHNEVLARFYSFSSVAGLYAAGNSLRREAASIADSIGEVFTGRGNICLRSDNAINNCQSRLEKAVYLNALNIAGDVKGNKIHLYFIQKDLRNSFAPHFYGEVQARPSGTMIKGRFTMNRFVRLFLAIWFTGIGTIAVLLMPLSVRSLLTGQTGVANPRLGLFFPPFLLVCCLLMVHWGKRMGNNNKAHILHFLQQSLNAHQEFYL